MLLNKLLGYPFEIFAIAMNNSTPGHNGTKRDVERQRNLTCFKASQHWDTFVIFSPFAIVHSVQLNQIIICENNA